ncbi:MAG TPA: SDR family NAD(P)-dependent oxidoreductase [Acidimicrobiales bacterium]|nr:SDR family NAD(P)-dependent oxidoreductase [Acidimicrobiales bacterium]
MRLDAGKVAVVTGAASGIGLGLAERFARSGLDVVLADVDEPGLQAASERVGAAGVSTLAVVTDVSDPRAVESLAAAAVERFGSVHVVCNNAGVVSLADPWSGPLAAWEWVVGVNLWGVVHGVRAFLPLLVAQGEGHIVNTASMAGLAPGFGAAYDATKHAVVALTEDLYTTLRMTGLPVGVSVLCPGWVRTGIIDAERNWPGHMGAVPPHGFGSGVIATHVRRALDEGAPVAAVADAVADAVEAARFWVLPHPEFVDLAVRRWHSIAEGADPEPMQDVPGLPPAGQIAGEIAALLTPPVS